MGLTNRDQWPFFHQWHNAKLIGHQFVDCRPKNLGGLGVLNIETFVRALHFELVMDRMEGRNKNLCGMDETMLGTRYGAFLCRHIHHRGIWRNDTFLRGYVASWIETKRNSFSRLCGVKKEGVECQKFHA
jgi:hypothetical protein